MNIIHKYPKILNKYQHLKEEINNTIIVGDFDTPFLMMDRSSRQKTIREHWT